MKKSSITGWKDIYSFTLVQTLKNKTFVISYVIMLVIVLAMVPVINLITSNSEEDIGKSSVEKVYVINETNIPSMDYAVIAEDETLSHIVFEDTSEEHGVIAARIEEQENDAVILIISDAMGLFSMHLEKTTKGSVEDSDLEYLSNIISATYKDYALNVMGITNEQLALINAPVYSIVSNADAGGEVIMEEDTSITSGEYWFIYALLFIVMMVNIMASTQIATSIVTEKSTKVIEYILVSVRPLAIIVGKILAMLTVVILQMGSLFLASAISLKLPALITGKEADGIMKFIPTDLFHNFNVFTVILCLLSIGLGLMFYGTLAGLAGSTISKLEELNEGLTLFTFTNIIGAYIGIGAANVLMVSGTNAFVTFAFLFPLSSPFLMPGAILLGKISIPLVALAVVLQIVFVILLAKFVAGIFEILILHNGNKIKVTELFKISKTVSKDKGVKA